MLALIAALTTGGGCGTSPSDPSGAKLLTITHRDGILEIEFDRPVEMNRVVLLDAESGNIVQTLPAAGKRAVFELPLASLDRELTAEIETASGPFTATLRPAEKTRFAAHVDIPLGQSRYRLQPASETHDDGDTDRVTVYVPSEQTTTLGLWIENRRQAGGQYRWELEAQRAVEWLIPQDSSLRAEEGPNGWKLVAGGELNFEFDQALAVVDFTLAAGATSATVDCRCTMQSSDGVEEIQRRTIELFAISAGELAQWLEIDSIRFPADVWGQPKPEQPSDAVFLLDPVWTTVRRWLRPAGYLRDPYAAYAYQAVEIENRAPAAVNLAIESEVALRADSPPLRMFAPPIWKSPRQTATAEHLLRVEPRAKATATLPLYVTPDVPPGSYVRRVRIYHLGSNHPVVSATAPLEVIRGNPQVTAVTLACLIICPAAWTVLAVLGRRIVARIGTIGLTTIGLLTGLHFLVSYVSRLGSNLLTALLGPMAIFVSGIANEGLTCLLMAVVVVLFPVPGSVSLASLALFLLNSTAGGQLGIAELVFVTVSIVLRESLLALLGVTTTLSPQAMIPLSGAVARWTPLRVALAIGVANALTLYIQFCLVQVLYRLFYAEWYVLAASLITGLGFGLVGGWLGARLGMQLRRVAR